MRIVCCDCGLPYEAKPYLAEGVSMPIIECTHCGLQHTMEFTPFRREVDKKEVSSLKLSGPFYANIGGSRILSITAGTDHSAADDADVIDWDTADEFIAAVTIQSSAKDTEASTYKLQWQDDTDTSGYVDLAASGEMDYTITDSSWAHGATVATGDQVCDIVGGDTRIAGERVKGQSASDSIDLADEQQSELWFGINPNDADAAHVYSFQLYSIAEGAAVGVLGALLTMATGAQSGTGAETASITEAQTTQAVFNAHQNLIVSVCENDDYTTFTNATTRGFNVTSDGSATHQVGTADEISFVSGKKYVVEFDSVLNSGTAPKFDIAESLAGVSISVEGAQLMVSGANVFVFTCNTTTTGVVRYYNSSTTTDFEITNLSASGGEESMSITEAQTATIDSGEQSGTGAETASITEAQTAALSIPLLLTSTGDGTGVSKLDVEVSATTTFTLDGTARFYSNIEATEGESTTWEPTAGAERTIYVKCPSSTANMIISDNTVTSFKRSWISDFTNHYSLGGDIGQLTALIFYRDFGPSTISGDIALLTAITHFEAISSNTISGSVTALTSLNYLLVTGSNTISGSVTALTSLTALNVQGSNTLSGSIAGLTLLNDLYLDGSNTVSGSIAGLTLLTQLINWASGNTLTGAITNLTSLTYIGIAGNNTISGDLNGIVSDLTSCTITGENQMEVYTSGATWGNGTITINPAVGYGYSSAEIDNMLIDMAASSPGPTSRTITLLGSSEGRTSASDAAVTDLEDNHLCTVVTWEARSIAESVSITEAQSATIDVGELSGTGAESVSVNDAPTADKVLSASTDESASIDDAPTGIRVLTGAAAESSTVDEAQTVQAILNDTNSESLSINEAQSATGEEEEETIETFSIDEAQTVQANLNDADTESLSVDDASTVQAELNDVDAESASVNDAQDAVFETNGVGAESSSINDESDANQIAAASTDESASIDETQDSTKTQLATGVETLSVDDASTVQAVLNDSVSESVSVNDEPLADEENEGSCTESTTIGEEQTVQANINTSIDESASITEAQTGSVDRDVTGDESATITESQTGQVGRSDSASESASISEVQTTQADLNASISESVSVSEAQISEEENEGAISESVSIDDAQTVQAELNDGTVESASIDDTTDATRVLVASISESASIDDTTDATIDVGAVDGATAESLSIGESCDAQLIAYPDITESVAVSALESAFMETNAVIGESASISEINTAAAGVVDSVEIIEGESPMTSLVLVDSLMTDSIAVDSDMSNSLTGNSIM